MSSPEPITPGLQAPDGQARKTGAFDQGGDVDLEQDLQQQAKEATVAKAEFQCSICGRSFGTKQGLTRHRTVTHNSQSKKQGSQTKNSQASSQSGKQSQTSASSSASRRDPSMPFAATSPDLAAPEGLTRRETAAFRLGVLTALFGVAGDTVAKMPPFFRDALEAERSYREEQLSS